MAKKRTLVPTIFDPFGVFRDFRDFFPRSFLASKFFENFSLPDVDSDR